MLVKGIENPQSRTYYSGVGYALATEEAEEKHRELLTSNHWNCSVIKDTRPISEDEYFIGEEVEDEDPNTFAYKYKLLARGRAHASLSALKYHRRYLKSPTTLSDQASYKYLLQGVLRI
ncbi:hypothetical protein L3C95_18550 [Chitinophaga filiformis]|uniref:hypothetical protein n=1 Tax=Chitinophaga filiformis TaxID=104663 RepID=UPI001F25F368|nr:hypothetical protein [Chitinophaga filiformis]MCF6404907.1 hypothetical protein [Chitinophaga filiformis]